jgi:hypothetical protein
LCNSIPSNLPKVCNGNGNSSSVDNCICKLGYIGKFCEFSIFYGIPSNISTVCYGNGICISPNNCACFNMLLNKCDDNAEIGAILGGHLKNKFTILFHFLIIHSFKKKEIEKKGTF